MAINKIFNALTLEEEGTRVPQNIRNFVPNNEASHAGRLTFSA